MSIGGEPSIQSLNIRDLGYQQAYLSNQKKQSIAHLHIKNENRDCWVTLIFDHPMDESKLREHLQNKETKQKINNFIKEIFHKQFTNKEDLKLTAIGDRIVMTHAQHIIVAPHEKSLSETFNSAISTLLPISNKKKQESDPNLKIVVQKIRPLFETPALHTFSEHFLDLVPDTHFFLKMNQVRQSKIKLFSESQCATFEELYCAVPLATTHEQRMQAQSVLNNFISGLKPTQQKALQQIIDVCSENDLRAIQQERLQQIGLLTESKKMLFSENHTLDKYLDDILKSLPNEKRESIKTAVTDLYDRSHSGAELGNNLTSTSFVQLSNTLDASTSKRLNSALIDCFIEDWFQMKDTEPPKASHAVSATAAEENLPSAPKNPITLFKTLAPVTRFFGEMVQMRKTKILTESQCARFESLYCTAQIAKTQKQRTQAYEELANFVSYLDLKQQKALEKIMKTCAEKDHTAIQNQRLDNLDKLPGVERALNAKSNDTLHNYLTDLLTNLPLTNQQKKMITNKVEELYERADSPSMLRMLLNNLYIELPEDLRFSSSYIRLKSALTDCFIEDVLKMGIAFK